MQLSDLLRLPPGAMLMFLVLIWPAVWATFLIVVSLGRDFGRQTRKHQPTEWHKAA